ncbi:beta/gamma crystallin family protein [Phenylobacterium sp. LjRoot164]|uniref:beta/gamma crystallin-related protein n=1 Tax=unclassified Phenylobacterium TaxID=2640670 RepID=UPI003ECC6BD2
MLSRIILASAALLALAVPASAQDRMAPNAQLFSATNYEGRSLTVVRDMPVIPATWSARSIRMGGGSSWEVCELPNFRGRCTVLTGSSTNLQAQLGVSGVRSIRAAATPLPQPVPGGGGRSLKGMAAEFFPAPESRGRRIEACNREGGGSACITREADSFCKSMGYVRSRNSAAQTISGRIFLADVLCSRWN